MPAIVSKRNEFHMYGYASVSNEDIWAFCVQKTWKKQKVDTMPVHQVIHDILQLTPATYMTFTQIEEQREANWFSELNSEELQMLLTPKNQDEQSDK